MAKPLTDRCAYAIGRLLALAGCIVLAMGAAPAWAAKKQPGFLLSTSQTYAPGQTPKIQIQFREISHLDFRIYRVKDPVAFFRQLKNPHQLGGPTPTIPQTRTPLERWHRWKRNLLWEWHDFLRHQFSSRFRRKYVERHAPRVYQQLPLHVSRFAQVPLLNSRQLVVSWREIIPRTRDWEARSIPCYLKQPGLYLVEAVWGGLRAYTLIFVTRLALVTKAAPGQLLVYAADRTSGQPLSGADIYLRADLNPLTHGITGQDGTTVFPLSGGKPRDWLVLARSGSEFAASDLPSWDFSSATVRNYQGYLYTERPVYRPGQTVDYKGILRRWEQGHYQLPRSRTVTVVFKDPDGKTVENQTRPVSVFGTFSGTMNVPITAAIGQYSFQAEPAGTTGDDVVNASGSFSVEDYKLPTYYVNVTPAHHWLLQGGSMSAEIQANYYYGAPVANAKVEWKLFRGFDWNDYDYAQENAVNWGDYDSSTPVAQGQGRLDTQGKFAVTLPVPVDPNQLNLDYTLRASVTDAANRAISGSGSFIATYASFHAVVQPDRYVYAPGQTATLSLSAQDFHKHPVAAAFEVIFEHWDEATSKYAPLQSYSASTNSQGNGTFTLPVPKAGDYRVRINATDRNGRAVKASCWIWVFGSAAETGQYGSIQLIADRPQYQPDDTAHVMAQIPSPPASGVSWLLITTERDRVYSHFVQKVQGSSAMLDIPIPAIAVPNLYVSATSLSQDQLKSGSVDLKVPPRQQELTVTVQPSKQQYLPHSPANMTVTVRDAVGRPVAADVSLGVVDESVYAIEPDTNPGILPYFYGKQSDQVDTEFSTDYAFTGWAGHAALQLAELRRPYSLADFKGARNVQPQVRKNFRETAFWQADILTGPSGRASVKFTWPDSLTEWRITAYAVTRATRVGQTVAHVITRKNLILELALPRFAVQGDEWTSYSIVHNYLPEAVPVQATLKAPPVPQSAGELTIVNPAPQKMQVASNGQQRVGWTLRAMRTGDTSLLGEALTPVESDAVELPLPVRPNGIRMDQSQTGTLRGQRSEQTEWTVPAQVVPDASYLSLRLTPSLAGKMFSALDYLIQYPYGCTEQTTSAMLGTLAVNRTLERLGGTSTKTQQQILPRLRAGLDRLAGSQNADGGWGWWPSTPSDPYMTADAVMALAETRQAGFPVPSGMLTNGRAAILHLLDEYPRMVPALRAYLLEAVRHTGPVPENYVAPLWQGRNKLSPYGQASLLLILAAQNDARAARLAARLSSEAKRNAEEAWWSSDFDPLLGIWDDDSPETTAHVLRALIAADAESKLAPLVVRWLVNNASDDYWYSTKQTAEVMQALAAYLARSNELKPDFQAIVRLNDKVIYQHRFTAADLGAQPVQLRLPVHRGPVQLSVERQGQGVLYWSANLVTFSTNAEDVHRGSFKLNVVRQYYRLVSHVQQEKNGEQKILYHTVPISGPLQTGDVVLVRLTISGDAQRYLLVEDPIPAGTEPIAYDDLYPLLHPVSTEMTWWARRELHDNRVSFFQSGFGPGQESFTYLLRVNLPGSFQALPTRVAPMYDPTKLATGTSQKFQFVEGKP